MHVSSHRAIPGRPAPFARTALGLAVGAALASSFVVASPAFARTTGITISSRTEAFGGYEFTGVGKFERIVGTARGELDPNDPHNAVITDIALAPRNAAGKVEYVHNFYILKPLDLSKGNHKMMYEPPNRGGKTYQALNRTPTSGAQGNDPSLITDPEVLANSFLWTRGYTTTWSGWEDLVNDPAASLTASAKLPIATNAGAVITGPAYEYIVTGNATFTLAYAAASTDKTAAILTHRVHLDDPPQPVAAADWDYTSAAGTAIKLNTGNFVANDIYEFAYVAKNPKVAGVGFAAVRDFNSFLRNATAEEGNPLAGDVTRIYTEISSQPGRLLNDFRHLGFNEDEDGRKVFDGLMQWVAAGDGINMNYRWSQSGRTERNRQDHLYLEGLFPFANQTTYDPISDTTDGRYKKCTETATNTCPLAMEFYSSNEYWVKAASLFHTDPTGTWDLEDHPQARLYNLASKQHGGAGNRANKGACQNFLNPLDSAPVQRALFEALDQWSTQGIEPPASAVPKLSNHTMVPPLPQSGVGFPNIPGVTYTGLQSTRYRMNYGPDFYTTFIPTINPPVVSAPYQNNPANGPIYPSYVPTTDSDGNEIAGIRLPELTAPLATYMGWNLRAGPQANDGCEGSGSYVPFAQTKAERLASGDPRPSVEERYKSFGQYAAALAKGIDDLVKNRYLLCEDVAEMQSRLTQDGLDFGVPAPKGNQPLLLPIAHCQVK